MNWGNYNHYGPKIRSSAWLSESAEQIHFQTTLLILSTPQTNKDDLQCHCQVTKKQHIH